MNENKNIATQNNELKSHPIENYIFNNFNIKNKEQFRYRLGFLCLIICHLLFHEIDVFQKKLEDKDTCIETDPIWQYDARIDVERDVLCKSNSTLHVCYKNALTNNHTYDGVTCKMKNFTMDVSKFQSSNFTLDELSNENNKCFPKISYGFFNMKCSILNNTLSNLDKNYEFYFQSWNYETNSNINTNDKAIKELAPNKTVLFITRTKDTSQYLYKLIEFLNTFAVMNSFYLNPEDMQVVFLGNVDLDNDPFYDLYKEVISLGTEPMYIKKLNPTKKYFISAALFIPTIYDSPFFIKAPTPRCLEPTRTYDLLIRHVKEDFEVKRYTDSISSISSNDNKIYYPLKVVNPGDKIYNKFITVLWRRPWPEGKTGEKGILGNGNDLVNALMEKLPQNYLIRLVDTSKLSIKEQISIIKKTDYLIGQYGPDMFLSIFLPMKAIVQEICYKECDNMFQLMSSLSGHLTYSNLITSEIINSNDNELINYNVKEFTKVVVNHMKKSNFFN